MLAEYALIPDIFDETLYSAANLCPSYLERIRETVFEEALVTNLADGAWSKYLTANDARFHRVGKEIVKNLRKQNRFSRRPLVTAVNPSTDREWADEAIVSHASEPLNGIIVSNASQHLGDGNVIVSSIEQLNHAAWWNARSPSIRLRRDTAEYLRVLRLVLGYSNSVMFIDPNLDPTSLNYSEFHRLLVGCARSNANLNPQIELHRTCYIGSGQNKRLIPNSEWENSFRRVLAPQLGPLRLAATVFIWDDFHDRYLLSNLIGISAPYGFDTTRDPASITTWTRLGRKDADDVQREFDPASGSHDLKHRFSIP